MVFPNVPLAPGVPPIPRPPGIVPTPPILLASDAIGVGLPSGTSVQWGLFDGNGNVVVAAESVASFDYKQDWQVSDYPIEQGSFETYNKVQLPFDVRFRFTAGSSDQARANLLNSIDAIANSFQLYTAITPERVYQNVSVQHYDLRRESRNGVGLIVVDVWAIQVRLLATATFSQTAAPSGATAQDGGLVQAQSASPAQAQVTQPLAPAEEVQAVGQTPTPVPSPGVVGTVPASDPGQTGIWQQFQDQGVW